MSRISTIGGPDRSTWWPAVDEANVVPLGGGVGWLVIARSRSRGRPATKEGIEADRHDEDQADDDVLRRRIDVEKDHPRPE